MSFQNILTLGFIISVCSWSGARSDLSPQKREAPESICPPEWMFFNGGCYNHEDTKSTWDEAEIACIAADSHLVEITSAAENTFLANLITNASIYSFVPAWIGLNDREINGTHIWYSSGNVTSYTNWDAYQPNDVTGQACVQMYSTGRWNDMRCSEERDYICERPAEAICPSGWMFFRGGCYNHEGTKSTWDEAEIACIAADSHLAEITSAAENTFLAILIKNASIYSFVPAWIGLNDREINGTHIWYSSGNVTSYTNWDAYQPNDVTGQACVQMYSTGRWNDMRSSEERHYICERPAEAICPSGWMFFRGGCYNHENTKSTWDEAEIACIAADSHLAEITSAAENTFLAILIKNASIYSFVPAWIGLNDREINGTHIWYSSGNVTSYTNWDAYQPNDVTGQACVQMYSTGRWNDMRSSEERHYICERPAEAICPLGWMFFRGGCYNHENTKSTWDQAEIACIAAGSHLVEITSAAENTFLAFLIKNASIYSFTPAWIGLNDREINGTHIWYSSGNVTSYTNWDAYQPNDVTGQACVQMYSTGRWNDMRSSEERHYICERPAEALCPPGWTFFRKDCYNYDNKRTDWDHAEGACNASEGHLTDITSASENTFLVQLMKSVSMYATPAWIGLHDREINGTHVWVSNGKVATFTNWDAYQPNDVTGLACVQMYISGLWNDMRCSFTRGYICERPVKETCEEGWSFFDRRCYKYVDDKWSQWELAKNSCIARGAGLVEITSAALNEFLVDLRNEKDIYGIRCWIGLNLVDDSYIWYQSGNNASYLNWASGEPNNYNNAEDCVEMYHDGKWNDNYCSSYKMFFCEKPSIVIPY